MDTDSLVLLYSQFHPGVTDKKRENVVKNEVYVDWFIRHMSRKCKHVEHYRRSLKLLDALTGRNQVLAFITEDTVTDAVAQIGMWKKESGVKNWINDLKRFYDYCISLGLRDDNPVQNAFFLYSEKQAAEREQNKAKIAADKLLRFALKYEKPSHMKTGVVILLYLYADVNLSEMSRMKVGDYDIAAESVRIGDIKTVMLNKDTARALDQYISLLRESGTGDSDMPMFANEYGNPVSRQCLWYRLKDVMQKVGAVDVVPGTLQGFYKTERRSAWGA